MIALVASELQRVKLLVIRWAALSGLTVGLIFNIYLGLANYLDRQLEFERFESEKQINEQAALAIKKNRIRMMNFANHRPGSMVNK